MNLKHASILIVLGTIATAIAWDVVLAAHGKLNGDSWCDAVRTINRASAGLLALTSAAVWLHIFLQEFIPLDWR